MPKLSNIIHRYINNMKIRFHFTLCASDPHNALCVTKCAKWRYMKSKFYVLFFAKNSGTLLLHRRSRDAFYFE